MFSAIIGTNTKTQKQHYHYVITTDTPMYPRNVAGEILGSASDLARSLVSVTDLQNHKHIYGATYKVRIDLSKQIVPANAERLRAEMGL